MDPALDIGAVRPNSVNYLLKMIGEGIKAFEAELTVSIYTKSSDVSYPVVMGVERCRVVGCRPPTELGRAGQVLGGVSKIYGGVRGFTTIQLESGDLNASSSKISRQSLVTFLGGDAKVEAKSLAEL
ncbi:hypothetical protein C8F04DRAFT_1181165 [Mycena alexandri]|uniref:Uncharacterized protein n=1 Tax=Mycena alexandri TaxID=1745969 RepID=A0AAD6SZT9_9AGAR|nr:hypothetical protein C8F04DRAFT_1181165 [Mycena alexandri]